MKKWILVITLVLGSWAQASDFKFSVEPKENHIFAVSQKTCEQQAANVNEYGVAANSIHIPYFKYQWQGEGAFSFTFIRIDAENEALAGGSYTCVISDDTMELTNVLNPSPIVVSESQSDQVFHAGCGLRCGGIQMNSTVDQAKIPAKVSVFGVQSDEYGVTKFVSSEMPITLIYNR
jgi:hypothetical protein